MKIEIKANNRIWGIEINVDYIKYKLKNFLKNLLGALGFVALFLLGSMEVNPEVSPLMTILIYMSLLTMLMIGLIAISSDKVK